MTIEKIKDLLVHQFGVEIIVSVHQDNLQPYLILQTERLAEACLELHDNAQTYFDFLSCLTGIDNGPDAGTMEVVYSLYSIPYDQHLTLKVQVPRNQEGEPLPEVPTVSHIWRSADWHEREVYDLVGIRFRNHPDMRRILCASDWDGHPLRKDYKLQDYYHGIKVPFDNHNQFNGFQGEPQQLTSTPTPFSDKRAKPD